MDPQQRLFLQTVWGTVENAGYTCATLPRNTGVYLGVISSDYSLNAYQAALSGWSHYRMSDYYQIPNRVSYYFDLHGPSLAIDSACSSSASALHLACQSLKQGDCETAIVGGVNFIAHPSRLIQYAQMQMISRSGNCSPFSDAADGTLFGEGVCALLLKPLCKAIEDGDPIHGVIKSTAVNSGGKTNGFTVPNPTAHAQLISSALVKANIHPRTVSYIEAHGTATNLGEPIEIRGLSEGFAAAESVLDDAPVAVSDTHWCSIGSVKSNIGHLESCAALAGIVKCLLQMKHQMLVPSLTNGNFDATHAPLPPNSKIDFDKTPLKIQYTAEAWRPAANIPRRAGISSFGAGGSNGHVIIEEPPAVPIESALDAHRYTHIAIFSAPEKKQLVSLAEHTRMFLKANDRVALDSVCYTLQIGREHFAHRLAIHCDTRQQLIDNLTDWLQGVDNAQTGYQHTEQVSLASAPQASLTLEESVTHWLAGNDIDWQQFYPHRVQKIALPGLEFQGRDFRIPGNYSYAPTERVAVNENPFIGQALDSPHISNTLYETRYDLQNLPYLTDHRIYDKVVVPGSMYVSYVLSIARELWPNKHHQLSNLTFIRALLPGENQPQRVQFSAIPESDGSQILSIISHEHTSNHWHEHFSCYLQTDTEYTTLDSVAIDDIIARMTNCIAVEDFYTESIDIGFSWGPQFQCVKQLYRRDGEALGLVTLVDALMPLREDYAIHPAFLDACFQVFVPGMSSTGLQQKTRQAYLPLGVNEVHFYRPVPLNVWSHVITRDDLKKDSLIIDIFLYTEDGEVVAYFKEMQVLRTSKEALMALTKSSKTANLGYTTEWQTLAPINTDAQEIANVAFCGTPLDRPLQNTQYLRYFEGDDCIQKALETQAAVNVFYILEPVYSADGDQLLENALATIEQIQTLIRRFENTVYAPGIKLYLAIQARDEHIHYLNHCFVGLARVIAIEYPQFWGGFIEIGKTGLSPDQLYELLTNHNEDHFRVGSQLQVPRLAPVSISTEEPDVIHDDGSYLITGAFGSLGQLVAKHLVDQGAKKLLLLSRREPDKTQLSFIKTLREQGAEIDFAAVDLTQRDALQAFIDSHHKTLKGVVHLAGVLEDGAFANLTREQFRRVLSPKVTGTWHLHQCTQNIPLNFFVLYSSASSLLGAAGQANYAVANAFMDAFAHYRRSLGLAAESVNWGPWSGAGMAADQDVNRKTWTNSSFGSLSPDNGLRYFSAICGDTSLPVQVAVLPYDWKALFRHYPVQKIPSLLRNLDRQAQPATSQQTVSQQDADIAAFAAQGLASAERKRLVIHYLRKQVRYTLGFEESDTIDANCSFLEIGFDSLMAVSFRTALANSLNCYFPATLVFDFPNLNQLSEYIVEQLQEAEQETAASTNSEVTEQEACHDNRDAQVEEFDYIDFSTLNIEQVEKLLESELDDIERILEA
jgi:acyl transferase domain-containing protein/acyl carrier protein